MDDNQFIEHFEFLKKYIICIVPRALRAKNDKENLKIFIKFVDLN